MPERVAAAVILGHQHVVGDRLAQQLNQVPGRLRRDLGEQIVVHPLAGDGGDLQQPLGRLRQRLHPRQQQVSQRLRQLAGPPVAAAPGGQQLFGEERVAL